MEASKNFTTTMIIGRSLLKKDKIGKKENENFFNNSILNYMIFYNHLNSK
jgi:hypothetical protein